MNINEFQPTSGRFIKEDGTTVNIADALNGKSVSDKVYDIDNMMPHSGRFIKEDGTCANIADMIANGDISGGGGGGGSSDDSAPPIIEEYNGQVIQSFISADRPLQGLKLFATTKQATTTGVQLFDLSTVTKGVLNVAGGIYTSECCETSDFIPVEPSTQYVSNFSSAYIKFYNSDKAPIQTESIDVNINTNSFTTGETTAFIRYSYNLNTVTPSKLIIAKGSSLPDYEPYTGGIPSPNGDYPQEIQAISDFVVEVKNSMGEVATPQTLNVTIPEQGFYGIPVTKGGNYTDTDGQQWICDEIDFANKKLIKRVGYTELNGVDDEGEWLGPNPDDRAIQFHYRDMPIQPPSAKTPILCNRAINNYSGEPWTITCNVYSFFVSTPLSINSLQAFKDFISENTLKVFYPLRYPTEYDLTNEQVEQFKKLKSYYGTTYIDNDAVPVCNMTADIVVDTKMYIDSKLSS